MKYIKIAVPDEFDPNTHKVYYENTNDVASIDYPTLPANVWQPQYKQVLDHGYVGLVDFMGDDHAAVEAARVSYGNGTQRKRSDEGLIRYLMRHRHTTPFEMIEFKFHVRAPIFVFRQWHRHRTASINEYSARYSELDATAYVPSPEHIAPQSRDNKQGRGGEMSDANKEAVRIALEQSYADSFQTYQYLLGKTNSPAEGLNHRRLACEHAAMQALNTRRQHDPSFQPTAEEIEQTIREFYAASDLAFTDTEYAGHDGLSRELARMAVPVATYSQMYWKANLHNLLHFIGLRSDPHAQYEIRTYSDAMLELIEPYVPWTLKAFLDYRMNGKSFSAAEVAALQILAIKAGLDAEALGAILRERGASDREIAEFTKNLGMT